MYVETAFFFWCILVYKPKTIPWMSKGMKIMAN